MQLAGTLLCEAVVCVCVTGTVSRRRILLLGRSRLKPGKSVNQNCQNRARIRVTTSTSVLHMLAPIRIGLYLR